MNLPRFLTVNLMSVVFLGYLHLKVFSPLSWILVVSVGGWLSCMCIYWLSSLFIFLARRIEKEVEPLLFFFGSNDRGWKLYL